MAILSVCHLEVGGHAASALAVLLQRSQSRKVLTRDVPETVSIGPTQ
jgi:hypothetical protein